MVTKYTDDERRYSGPADRGPRPRSADWSPESRTRVRDDGGESGAGLASAYGEHYWDRGYDDDDMRGTRPPGPDYYPAGYAGGDRYDAGGERARRWGPEFRPGAGLGSRGYPGPVQGYGPIGPGGGEPFGYLPWGYPPEWAALGYGYGYRGRGGRDWRGGDDPTRGHERNWMDRAADEVGSWFGFEGAEERRREDHRGRGPKGYQRSDSRIQDDVNDYLTDDSTLDASGISITVKNREVTLDGTVDSRQAKRRAEDCVEAVSGVTHVQNNLRVRGREAAETTERS